LQGLGRSEAVVSGLERQQAAVEGPRALDLGLEEVAHTMS